MVGQTTRGQRLAGDGLAMATVTGMVPAVNPGSSLMIDDRMDVIARPRRTSSNASPYGDEIGPDRIGSEHK